MLELTKTGSTGKSAYIASHFFNPMTLGHVEKIKALLEKHGIGYFSPKDSVNLSSNASRDEQEVAFRQDVDAIVMNDFVVGNTSMKDQGSHFEFGYAFANKIPLIYIWPQEDIPNRRDLQFNLMLARSGVTVVYDFDELDAVFEKLVKSNFDFDSIKAEYNGTIE
jgi:nucleoside 2-deoxyribosyltransferase